MLCVVNIEADMALNRALREINAKTFQIRRQEMCGGLTSVQHKFQLGDSVNIFQVLYSQTEYDIVLVLFLVHQ